MADFDLANEPLIAFTDAELRRELDRRYAARTAGKCDACGRWHDEESCGSERHGAAASQWHRRWLFEYGSSYLMAYKDGDQGIRSKAYVSVSRYGVGVRLFGRSSPVATATDQAGEPEATVRYDFAVNIAETELPTDYTNDYPRSKMNDRERLEWSIDWAIKQLET